MRAMVVAVLGLGLLLGPWLATHAKAGPPLDQLRAQIDRVIKLLEDPELKRDGRGKDRRTAVRKVADEIFDFEETAKRSLARHWQPRSAAERNEFVRLFAALLERSYISKIELYGGEKIAYLGDQTDGDQALVRTRILTKGGAEIPVEYRMLKKAERWLVYDVIIEGVSLVANYRTQFNKIIQTSSYAELVKRMKVKQDEFIEASTKKS
ncbi:MAG: ABC transporter substrate-binding protein [Candidatus Rokubacteria bacterium]|nr:ABC transporter substrate-binding protein [Candidatus Rokubacteria bacterium]